MFTRNGRTRLVQSVLRWTARTLSLVSTVVLLLFLFGEPFEVWRITTREWIGLALFPLGIVIGFAIACRRESLGGAITVASLLLFCLLFVNNITKAWAFFVFSFPGLLFLASGLLSRLWKPVAARFSN